MQIFLRFLSFCMLKCWNNPMLLSQMRKKEEREQHRVSLLVFGSISPSRQLPRLCPPSLQSSLAPLSSILGRQSTSIAFINDKEALAASNTLDNSKTTGSNVPLPYFRTSSEPPSSSFQDPEDLYQSPWHVAVLKCARPFLSHDS